MATKSSTMVKFSEKQILNSKTPEEYIDRTLHSNISRGRKTVLCKQWKEKTGFTTEDIQRARNRHPYWKTKKMAGWQDRNYKRWSDHDYRETNRSNVSPFSNEQIIQFYELNKKDKRGRYLHKDWEVAKEMKITIPAVQHWRRKLILVYKILELEQKSATKKNVVKYLHNHENGLRKIYREFNS
jgi:hypothetical protein